MPNADRPIRKTFACCAGRTICSTRADVLVPCTSVPKLRPEGAPSRRLEREELRCVEMGWAPGGVPTAPIVSPTPSSIVGGSLETWVTLPRNSSRRDVAGESGRGASSCEQGFSGASARVRARRDLRLAARAPLAARKTSRHPPSLGRRFRSGVQIRRSDRAKSRKVWATTDNQNMQTSG